MSKYTPGPWRYEYYSTGPMSPGFDVVQADGARYTQWASDVVTVYILPGTQPIEVAEANARLIAAAIAKAEGPAE